VIKCWGLVISKKNIPCMVWKWNGCFIACLGKIKDKNEIVVFFKFKQLNLGNCKISGMTNMFLCEIMK